MKTGKVTSIYETRDGRHIEIQVRVPADNASRIDVYSVRTNDSVQVGDVVVLPENAEFRGSFFA